MIYILIVIRESCDYEWSVGNLMCEDGNNHKGCHFDGGDCCLGSYGIWDHCSECFCQVINKASN